MLVVLSCSSSLSLSPVTLGSKINQSGAVTDTSLTYSFTEYTGNGTVRDLFNHLYFQGDEIFFSFEINRTVSPEQISVRFCNADGTACLPAERVMILEKRSLLSGSTSVVYGFSLVGSVLEAFNRRELKKPAPADRFCCRDIPLAVSVDVNHEGGKAVRRREGSLRINYR